MASPFVGLTGLPQRPLDPEDNRDSHILRHVAAYDSVAFRVQHIGCIVSSHPTERRDAGHPPHSYTTGSSRAQSLGDLLPGSRDVLCDPSQIPSIRVKGR